MARPRKQQLPGWQLEAVLTRRPRRIEGAAATVDSTEFFHREYDLIVEAAGPSALAAHACEALARADLWTVSAAALVDAQLEAAVNDAARRGGHRLRLLHGAIAGLDEVAAACVDPHAELHLQIDLPPGGGPPGVIFTGTVREAARRFPDSVNVAVAAALAGPWAGPDAHRGVASGPSRAATARAERERPLRKLHGGSVSARRAGHPSSGGERDRGPAQ